MLLFCLVSMNQLKYLIRQLNISLLLCVCACVPLNRVEKIEEKFEIWHYTTSSSDRLVTTRMKKIGKCWGRRATEKN